MSIRHNFNFESISFSSVIALWSLQNAFLEETITVFCVAMLLLPRDAHVKGFPRAWIDVGFAVSLWPLYGLRNQSHRLQATTESVQRYVEKHQGIRFRKLSDVRGELVLAFTPEMSKIFPRIRCKRPLDLVEGT